MEQNTLTEQLILLFGPLTEPEPITNQNQDKTKQNITVKKLSNPQPTALLSLKDYMIYQYSKKKKHRRFWTTPWE